MSDNPLRRYPKVYNLGHPALDRLLDGPVVVEEKVDGSQFAFGLIDETLTFRSKNAVVRPEDPQMFGRAVEAVTERRGLLEPGWTYRAEYLAKPKHNTLAYGRVPLGHLIVFDIEIEPNRFLGTDDREHAVDVLDLEAVPVLHQGPLGDLDTIESLLDRESVLGGPKVEGVVIKNHNQLGRDGLILAGKHVSEAFRESHQGKRKRPNPNGEDIKQQLADTYAAEARWQKAVQHLREDGDLTGTVRDIGPLMRAAKDDLVAEEEEAIKQALFDWAKRDILRGATGGLPQWYKGQLLEAQFEDDEDE